MRLAGSAVGGVANWDRLKSFDPAGVRMLRGDSSFGDAPPCTQCPTQSEAHHWAHSLLNHECCVQSHCCQPSRAHHRVHRICRTEHVHTASHSEVAVWTASILTDRSGKQLNPWPGNKYGTVPRNISLIIHPAMDDLMYVITFGTYLGSYGWMLEVARIRQGRQGASLRVWRGQRPGAGRSLPCLHILRVARLLRWQAH